MNNKNIIISISSFFLFLFSSQSFALTHSWNAIAQESYWLQLGHYQAAIVSDWKSEVDEDYFFLSPNGKRSPNAELLATIAAFNGENLSEIERQATICRFPARFNWLKHKIKNNWGSLDCPELQQWQSALDADTITLVFPTAFMNNPSSMFGHTLLRIDAKDQTRNKELVAFAVNFAAVPDLDDNPVTYAYKGLVGAYPGRFSLMSYYRKVQEYNDLESRDIWEYQLKFNADEVERVLLHLWELQSVYFDYYFIDENCSYQLLSLLQLANESIDLTSSFPMQAIPSDTVAALKNYDLLQEPHYRPAFGTKLFNYSEQLSDEELNIVRRVMDGEYLNISDHTPEKNAAILEMAYEWLNFKSQEQGLSRETVVKRSTQLLIARSKIKLTSPFLPPKQPLSSPEQGHASSRLGVSFTHTEHNEKRYNLSYRLAYHDLLDQSSGFIPGAKLSFLDIETSINDAGNTRLEQAYLIDMLAIPVDNRIFDNWSWGVRMGFDRQVDIQKESGRWFTQGGYGKSIGDPNYLQAYALGAFELNTGDITDNDFKTGIGSELGAIWQINNNNKAVLKANIMYLPDSDVDYHYQLDVDWNWSLDRNWALRSKVRYQKWRAEDTILKFTLYHYF